MFRAVAIVLMAGCQYPYGDKRQDSIESCLRLVPQTGAVRFLAGAHSDALSISPMSGRSWSMTLMGQSRSNVIMNGQVIIPSIERAKGLNLAVGQMLSGTKPVDIVVEFGTSDGAYTYYVSMRPHVWGNDFLAIYQPTTGKFQKISGY